MGCVCPSAVYTRWRAQVCYRMFPHSWGSPCRCVLVFHSSLVPVQSRERCRRATGPLLLGP